MPSEVRILLGRGVPPFYLGAFNSIRKLSIKLRKRIADAGSLDALPEIPTPPKLNKSRKRQAVRWGLIVGNVVLLVGIAFFMVVNRSASQTIRSGTINSVITTTNSLADPLDSLSSAQIALQAAQLTDLPELTAVRNQSDTETAQLSVAANDETVVAKPQLIGTAQKSKRDIISYTAVAGDTISSIAGRFGVNPQSVRWSNNINGESVAPGRVLMIPPANGIVYQVKANDSIDSIVSRYQVDRSTFITVNDAESGSLTVGEYLWLPGGSVAVAASSRSFSPGVVSGSQKFGSCRMSVAGVSGVYDCGYCTWWSAYRRLQIGNPVPGGLGNAITWPRRAQAMGLAVGSVPKAGAVIQFNSNHVAFVEKVEDDGTVVISEMNREGWDIKSYRTLSAIQASIYKYIY